MIIDFDKPSRGYWYTFCESRINEKGEIVYDEPTPDAGRVCVRPMGPILKQQQAGRTKKYDTVLNPETRAMERVGYYPDLPPEEDQKQQDDRWDYAIIGLEGFFDQAGNEIACTRENKVKLMQIPAFDRFIARCLRLTLNADMEEKEAERKNSSAG